MKASLYAMLICVLVLSACESSEEKMRKQVSAACSNEVVGITRIVSISIFPKLENFSGRLGKVTFEHINQVGGVERGWFAFETGISDGKPWVDLLPDMKIEQLLDLQFRLPLAAQ